MIRKEIGKLIKNRIIVHNSFSLGYRSKYICRQVSVFVIYQSVHDYKMLIRSYVLMVVLSVFSLKIFETANCHYHWSQL